MDAEVIITHVLENLRLELPESKNPDGALGTFSAKPLGLYYVICTYNGSFYYQNLSVGTTTRQTVCGKAITVFNSEYVAK